MIKFCTFSAILLAGFTTSVAFADEEAPKPDKSGYSLFNPTPESALRDLSADRPVKGILPITVDAGHIQVETDIANYGFGTYANVTTKSFLAADPLIKLGVTNFADIEIAPGSYQWIRTSDSTGHVTKGGYGDVTLKSKINLVGNDGGAFALALVPYIKLPSSTPLISNNAVEGGMIFSMQYMLPGDFLFVASPEYDILKNANDYGTHSGVRGAVSIGHAIPGIDKLSGIIEFYGQSGDFAIAPIYTLDLGLGYALTKNTQIDGGVNIGLNEAAPRLQIYTGVTQRF